LPGSPVQWKAARPCKESSGLAPLKYEGSRLVCVNVLPVIERELRAEARNVVTYGCRPLGAALLLLASIMFLNNRTANLSGRDLFTELHQFLQVTIWLWVPLVSADCISREKREQTLGLLFLTPLKARDIMLAKTLAQGLRAAMIGVAVIPVLTLPLLIGGLNWVGVLSSVLISASAFCWALAAGLLASVLSRSILGSLLWALLWSGVFLVVLSLLNGIAVFEFLHHATGRPRFMPSLEGLAGTGLLAMWNGEPFFYNSVIALTGRGIHFWLATSGIVLISSLVGLGLVWLIGAWRLQKAWQELPPSPARAMIEKQFCQPRFATHVFRSLMKRQLERNPVGWLEQRRWTSRVAAWGWLGIFALGYTAFYLTFSYTHEVEEFNVLMAASLMGAMALISSASFRRERETGVMELLLTTSLTPKQIVRGRLMGLWVQFLPSLAALVFMTGFSGFILNWTSPYFSLLLGGWISGIFFVCVPVCGLWFSLLMRHYLLSLLATVVIGIFLPVFILQVLDEGIRWTLTGYWRGRWTGPLLLGFEVIAFIVAGWGAWRLRDTIGWPGMWLLAAELIGIGVALSSPELTGGFYGRPVRPVILLMPCFAIGVAGFCHSRLLRMLGERTFVFKV
jgi:ABC-type transport system involved in multi-copper enzyme maturation permease subunit